MCILVFLVQFVLKEERLFKFLQAEKMLTRPTDYGGGLSRLSTLCQISTLDRTRDTSSSLTEDRCHGNPPIRRVFHQELPNRSGILLVRPAGK
jgi:hypothetical protein